MVVLCMLWASVAMAQDTATLMGQVTDRETGDVVPGAQIMLEGTALSEVADLGGRYILRDIPPGKVEVAISFIGYKYLDIISTNYYLASKNARYG